MPPKKTKAVVVAKKTAGTRRSRSDSPTSSDVVVVVKGKRASPSSKGKMSNINKRETIVLGSTSSSNSDDDDDDDEESDSSEDDDSDDDNQLVRSDDDSSSSDEDDDDDESDASSSEESSSSVQEISAAERTKSTKTKTTAAAAVAAKKTTRVKDDDAAAKTTKTNKATAKKLKKSAADSLPQPVGLEKGNADIIAAANARVAPSTDVVPGMFLKIPIMVGSVAVPLPNLVPTAAAAAAVATTGTASAKAQEQQLNTVKKQQLISKRLLPGSKIKQHHPTHEWVCYLTTASTNTLSLHQLPSMSRPVPQSKSAAATAAGNEGTGDTDDVSSLIESVEFRLHASFGEGAQEVVTKPPFLIRRVGWDDVRIILVVKLRATGQAVIIQHSVRLKTPLFHIPRLRLGIGSAAQAAAQEVTSANVPGVTDNNVDTAAGGATAATATAAATAMGGHGGKLLVAQRMENVENCWHATNTNIAAVAPDWAFLADPTSPCVVEFCDYLIVHAPAVALFDSSSSAAAQRNATDSSSSDDEDDDSDDDDDPFSVKSKNKKSSSALEMKRHKTQKLLPQILDTDSSCSPVSGSSLSQQQQRKYESSLRAALPPRFWQARETYREQVFRAVEKMKPTAAVAAFPSSSASKSGVVGAAAVVRGGAPVPFTVRNVFNINEVHQPVGQQQAIFDMQATQQLQSSQLVLPTVTAAALETLQRRPNQSMLAAQQTQPMFRQKEKQQEQDQAAEAATTTTSATLQLRGEVGGTAREVVVAHPTLSLGEMGVDAACEALDTVIMRALKDLEDAKTMLADAQQEHAAAQQRAEQSVVAAGAIVRAIHPTAVIPVQWRVEEGGGGTAAVLAVKEDANAAEESDGKKKKAAAQRKKQP